MSSNRPALVQNGGGGGVGGQGGGTQAELTSSAEVSALGGSHSSL